MEEAPHAHESLFANSQRHSHDAESQNSCNSSSEESLEEQDAVVPTVGLEPNSDQNPEPNPGAAAQICAQPSTFLLEPLILILLFSYNFSCKSCIPYKVDSYNRNCYFSYHIENSDHLSELYGGLWLPGHALQPAGHTKYHE